MLVASPAMSPRSRRVRSPTMIWSIGSTACVVSGVALVSAAWFCPEPMHCRDPAVASGGFRAFDHLPGGLPPNAECRQNTPLVAGND
jgi:hypothetical protein